jgi:hypothetical protein
VHRQRWQLWAGLLLVGIGTLLTLIAWPGTRQAGVEKQLPTATVTPEPIVPTRTPTLEAPTATFSVTVAPTVGLAITPAATMTPPATATESSIGSPSPTDRATPMASMPVTPAGRATATLPAPTDSPSATEIPLVASTPQGSVNGSALWLERPRWGVGAAIGPITRYDVEPLRLGWYLDWSARAAPARPAGAVYAPMIRLREGALEPTVEDIAAIAQANPGSLWLVGNEPDVKWQDNVEPAAYARLYHEAYTAIKTADSTAQVAIGGVSQPTPLRLRYLDAILGSYRAQFGVEMPVDVWNVHNFVLQELRGSWGVDIPPGISDDQGMLYEVNDSDNLEIFRQQIVDFRRWMAQCGYQDYPLIVSEYGVLMPEDFGFSPERVAAFMTGTFDFFSTAADPGLGYPADGYRLVQLWCWYSLDAPPDYYPTSNLFDPQTGAMTAVGQAWVAYVK